MQKKLKIILFYSIVACLLLYITENIFHPTYFIQMLQKILSFILIPILLGKYLWLSFWKFWRINKLSFLYWLWFWLFWALVIILSYYFLSNTIEWDAILLSLTERWVNQTTFIFIFLYIMLGNSLVEEYFFRWIVFRTLLNTHKTFAYILSSWMFALYHFAIFGTWFHGYILWLALFWLFVWWLFFGWLYQKTKWIWAAWIFHILVDFVILVIWYFKFFS